MWKETDKKPIGEFLLWTFLISWGSEVLIILLEHLGVIAGPLGKGITMCLIGFGAGLAPTYSVYILLKKHKKIKGIKDFCKRIFIMPSKITTLIAILACYSIFLMGIWLCEDYLGNPWYYFILYIPLMIVGGGLEEVGWRGFLQPALEERTSFIIATLIQGGIWAIWHGPLWFIQNANQSSFSFIAFSLCCMAFSFVLAILYKLTKSVLAVILMHAWINVVFGGMFTYQGMKSMPDFKLYLIFASWVVIAIGGHLILEKKGKAQQASENICINQKL